MGPRDELARDVWRAMTQLVLSNERRRDVVRATGLSFAKVRVVRRLAAGELSMGELAEQLNVDRPNLTTLIDDLEGAQLVARERNPSDGRVVMVRLTPGGERAAASAEEILSAPPEQLTALSPEELATMGRLLGRG